MVRSSSAKFSLIRSRDGLELPDDPGLRDVEHHLLGPVDEIHGRLLAPVAHLGDLAAHLDERAQVVVLAHDLGVVPGVGGRGHGRDQAVDERPSAHRLQAARLASSSQTVMGSTGSPREKRSSMASKMRWWACR